MKMLYAIVDIETTGGHANAHGITEIAIIIHDGKQIIEQFETLINPFQEIPIFIQGLTGITDEMVRNAPSFAEVAQKIFSLLDQKIFVAHNVNFDFSFVHHHLKKENFYLQSKKLCTVRLSRKIFPGQPSYSLGKLTRNLNINIANRHRAGGDAFATATLFKMLLDADEHQYIKEVLSAKAKVQAFPSFISKEEIENIPRQPGVYYFKDKKDKVIYVGKAKNLYKRISSHFSNNSPHQKKQHFLKEIRKIAHQVCGTELQALILENIEIKRLWPKQNKASKTPERTFGLYVYEDQKGYTRLGVGKKVKFLKPFLKFNTLSEGLATLKNMSQEFNLCPKLCNIQKNTNPCLGIQDLYCLGACEGVETPDVYNARVKLFLNALLKESQNYLIIDDGRNKLESSCILMEKGSFYGMGYLSKSQIPENLAEAKSLVTAYPSYKFIEKVLADFILLNPEKKVILEEN
jgi:DNA polymerase-3 subunit epsilon